MDLTHGEVKHYEMLISIAKDVKNKKFGTKVNRFSRKKKAM